VLKSEASRSDFVKLRFCWDIKGQRGYETKKYSGSPCANLSYENEFHLRDIAQQSTFSYEWFRVKTRFDPEGKAKINRKWHISCYMHLVGWMNVFIHLLFVALIVFALDFLPLSFPLLSVGWHQPFR